MLSRHRLPHFIFGATLLAALGACGRPPHPEVPREALVPGHYRATLLLPAGELPQEKLAFAWREPRQPC